MCIGRCARSAKNAAKFSKAKTPKPVVQGIGFTSSGKSGAVGTNSLTQAGVGNVLGRRLVCMQRFWVEKYQLTADSRRRVLPPLRGAP